MNKNNVKCGMWNVKRVVTTPMLFILAVGIMYVCLFPTNIAHAQTQIQFTPNVPLPGFGTQTIGPQSLGNYLRVIYSNAVRFGTFIALVMMVWGAFLYLVSGGFASQAEEAKSVISHAVFGLVLLFTAYVLLNTIDPNLLKLGPITVPKIGQQAGQAPTATVVKPTNNPTDPVQQQRTQQQATNQMDQNGACVTNAGKPNQQCLPGKTRQECQTLNGTFLSGTTCAAYQNKKPIAGVCVSPDGKTCTPVTINAPQPYTEAQSAALTACQQPGAQFFPNQRCDNDQFKSVVCVEQYRDNGHDAVRCHMLPGNTCTQKGWSSMPIITTCEAFCAQIPYMIGCLGH